MSEHITLDGEEDIKAIRVGADEWLKHCIEREIPEDDCTTARCRYLSDVEVLCVVIADIWNTSPSQVYAAGASYHDEDSQIAELDDMKDLRSKVLHSGNQSARAYVALDKYRIHLFEGRTKRFRLEKTFVETTSGIASGFDVDTCDLYLLNWWCWFSDFVDTHTPLNILKNDPSAKRGFRVLEDIKAQISDETTLWRKFLE